MNTEEIQRKLDIAWAAGLFEGEGCLTMGPANGGRNLRFRATLNMVDRDVVEKFARIVQVGSISQRVNPGTGRDTWYWEAGQQGAVRHLIDMFLPYFGARRSNKALEISIAMDAYDANRAPRTRGASPLVLNGGAR